MAKTAANTRSLTGYTVSYAPEGTTLPTAFGALDAAFDEIGFVSDDGITKGRNADVNEVRDAAGTLVRTFRDNDERTFKFVALEHNDVVRELIEPGTTTVNGADIKTHTVRSAAPRRGVFVLDLLDGGTTPFSRYIVPEGEVTPGDETTYVKGGVASVEITVKTVQQDDGTLYVEVEAAPGTVATP